MIMLDSLYCRMGNVESCTWVERGCNAQQRGNLAPLNSEVKTKKFLFL